MLNRWIGIGRLVRDPELRYTPASVAVTQFTIACDRPFSSNGGEKEADFIPIVTWRQLAENCANHLKKGRLVAVEGRIQVRNYENNEGKRQYVTEVIADNVRFLDGNRSQDSTEGQTTQNSGTSTFENRTYAPTSTYNDPFKDDGRPIEISEDMLPF